MTLPLPRPVFAFDLDGVLVDSEPVKRAAFVEACRDVLAPTPAELAAIGAYNGRQRGVPRSEKFDFVVHRIVRREPTLVGELDRRYATLLAERLPDVRLLPGVTTLLAGLPADRYVVTSAPEAETVRQLSHHGIADAFAGVHAHPVGKVDALRRIAQAHPGQPLAFFGDAPADQAAAVAAGVRFVPVNPNDHLRPRVSAWLTDFADLAAVRLLAGLTTVSLLDAGKAAHTLR